MQTVQLNHVRPAFANVLLAAGFSPNLQKFLKKHPHFTQIHFDPTDKIWYIGYMDENNIWCGAKFLDVLCGAVPRPRPGRQGAPGQARLPDRVTRGVATRSIVATTRQAGATHRAWPP